MDTYVYIPHIYTYTYIPMENQVGTKYIMCIVCVHARIRSETKSNDDSPSFRSSPMYS